jgi:Xaa-Pro dipeptidase
MLPHLSELYPQHLLATIGRATRALEVGGFDHLVVGAGVDKYRFLDDNTYPFHVNPQFKAWLPLTANPHCWIVFTPGSKPVLAYFQPADYWHLPPQDPSGYWVEHFDVRVIDTPEAARAHLPKDLSRAAIIAEPDAALDGVVPNNPLAVLNSLHWARAIKTPYEVQNMRAASARAARAHRTAEASFRAGKSEYEIHRDYCAAAAHQDNDLPYGNIVALNQHGATLHYQHQSQVKPAHHHSLLIDAGAQVHGYAADITRTYGDGDAEFAALIGAVDREQQILVSKVRAGQDYPALHLEAHRRLAGVLNELDLVRMSPESQVETGVSSAFYPHGLGHFLGLQVHDVGGFQKNEAGETIAKPEGHPYLRLTRALEPGNVLTIEPGIYFIDLLLAKLKTGAHAQSVNWDKVERLKKFGGVRVEDDVHVTDGEPENLTRNAFAEYDSFHS